MHIDLDVLAARVNDEVNVNSEIRSIVDRADLDDLVRLVDGLCASRAWADLMQTRDMCREATRTGRQVWPIATLCEYRLALHAPAEWAHRVIGDDSSRFTIGPLTEVIAQNHSWSDLNGFIAPGPHREIVAHERVLRGERVVSAESMSNVLDLPLELFDWEPEYPLAEYSDEGVAAPCPCDRWVHEWTAVDLIQDPTAVIVGIDDDETDTALRNLVEPWTAASGGHAQCIAVEGDLDALATASKRASLRSTSISSGQALQWLVWCAASGGSHGRRRGSSSGRFSAWWMLAAIAGLSHRWDELQATGQLPAELGRAANRLDWFRIDLEERHSYELSLAVVDHDENITIGLFAFDDPL